MNRNNNNNTTGMMACVTEDEPFKETSTGKPLQQVKNLFSKFTSGGKEGKVNATTNTWEKDQTQNLQLRCSTRASDGR
eukprot:CAMPEP_0178913424 /NCGR_PEP_ID=MMETSP0786-20121207/10833_1 /TAXON_ID=186022 /ORGANISM="Thalassionema frauenfeldii, Strain CCMP 1798" /LENGTH=77 /DNA_ID=CAMNT_0020586161 /DNA_START=128 /DNA_END=361 /DNA_ORIENTATION=+